MPQRKRERRLGPDWTQLGIGTVALAVALERLAHAAWIAWLSASWGTPYRELLALQRQDEPILLTTPREALSGSGLLLSALLLLVGLVLIRSAFGARRSPW